MTESTTLYCYVHPTRETSLRCNNCERPICAQCAVRTPTGYRCKECVRERQKTFETAEWYDFFRLPSGGPFCIAPFGYTDRRHRFFDGSDCRGRPTAAVALPNEATEQTVVVRVVVHTIAMALCWCAARHFDQV